MNPALYYVSRAAHYLFILLNYNFINDFQTYKMAENSCIVQCVKLYEFGKISLLLSTVHNKQFNRYSLDITLNFIYTNNGVTNERCCSIYFNLTTAKAFLD